MDRRLTTTTKAAMGVPRVAGKAGPCGLRHAVVVLLGTLVTLSCASYSYTPLNRSATIHPGTMPVQRSGIGPDHVLPPPVVSNHVVRSGSEYTLRRLSIPSVGDNGQADNVMTVRYYQGSGSGARPVVVVLPIWGISTYPPRAVSKKIRRASDGAVHVLEVQGDEQIMRWTELHVAADEHAFLAAWEGSAERERVWIRDLRRLIDWTEGRPEIDSTSIGLVGFSHSSLTSVVLAAHDQRIAAVVLAMGPARAHELIARCQGRRTTPVQIIAESRFGWDADELERRLEPLFRGFSPVEYSGSFDPSRVLIFDARDDPCIFESARHDLWVAMGRPERYTIHASHRKAFYSMTILGGNWMQRKVWEFFERTLLDPIEAPAEEGTSQDPAAVSLPRRTGESRDASSSGGPS
jgi:dienelactone hydrolase